MGRECIARTLSRGSRERRAERPPVIGIQSTAPRSRGVQHRPPSRVPRIPDACHSRCPPRSQCLRVGRAVRSTQYALRWSCPCVQGLYIKGTSFVSRSPQANAKRSDAAGWADSDANWPPGARRWMAFSCWHGTPVDNGSPGPTPAAEIRAPIAPGSGLFPPGTSHGVPRRVPRAHGGLARAGFEGMRPDTSNALEGSQQRDMAKRHQHSRRQSG
mmetsp:Transcript_65508/g.207070  ORF Transcript_65508/g.207070 Transcript_65508/m.207070 type:complete len:215 (+) Transcript_65508:2150-2794(+)